jgi:hypothetical protein
MLRIVLHWVQGVHFREVCHHVILLAGYILVISPIEVRIHYI